jgi:aspartyl-tRNA(Asn)/glutamyl-tRNA(Gln) amidotransferase subunit C
MTKISEDDVIHLTRLCRIACTPEERGELLKNFQRIVSYVDQLAEVDTRGVEPCNYVTVGHASTPLRDDIPENTLDRKDLMSMAPASMANLILVPSILKSS